MFQRYSSQFGGWWDDLTDWWRRLWTHSEEEETLKEEPSEVESTPRRSITDIIRENAIRYGVPQNWINAIIQVESNFNPLAISRTGARGLMQILPSTARLFGYDPNFLFDPEYNIEVGAKYLRYLIDRYGFTWDVISAYQLGRPIVGRSGEYINQEYVDRVGEYL